MYFRPAGLAAGILRRNCIIVPTMIPKTGFRIFQFLCILFQLGDGFLKEFFVACQFIHLHKEFAYHIHSIIS